jgi:hypothetical protein
MLNPAGDDVELAPLVAMNPMGKEHCAAHVEALLALDAEGVVARATAEAVRRLPGVSGAFRVGLVIPRRPGRWLDEQAPRRGERWLEHERVIERGWLVVGSWTGEEPSAELVRRNTLEVVYRTAHVLRHGPSRTLGAVMSQEGRAMAFGSRTPWLEPDDLEYTHEVLFPHRGSGHFPTIAAALQGDEAARAVGHPPLGLSARAGLALALAEALEADVTPEAALLEGTGLQRRSSA